MCGRTRQFGDCRRETRLVSGFDARRRLNFVPVPESCFSSDCLLPAIDSVFVCVVGVLVSVLPFNSDF